LIFVERVVVRVLAGEPVRLVARRFGVSSSSVVKWSQFRATGSAAAGKMGGHRPKLLVGQYRGWLICCEKHPNEPSRAPGHASATCSTPSPKTNVVVISLMQDTLQYKIIPL
jgi:transposase